MKSNVPAPFDRRLLAEERLLDALLPFGIGYVGVVLYIYEEREGYGLPQLLELIKAQLPPDTTDDEFTEVAFAVGDAWNYFPHARLHGECPGDVFERVRARERKKKR